MNRLIVTFLNVISLYYGKYIKVIPIFSFSLDVTFPFFFKGGFWIAARICSRRKVSFLTNNENVNSPVPHSFPQTALLGLA